MTRLHIFDMDGTLIADSTASLELARASGTEEAITALERRFAAGELDTRGFSGALYEVWRHLTPAHVDTAFAGGPFLDGIARVCADIRRRGEHSLVITMSPSFFAERLAAFGFDRVEASLFPAPPFTGPPDPGRILTPADKVGICERVRTALGVAPEHCIAYGDSMSDAPLFRHLPHTVAVNGDAHIDHLAAAAYRGRSLEEAYRLGRGLVEDGAAAP
ncbi:HAD family hydrolase [Nocardiopsis baichengensis]|uniref:HAD family hydrolase n=1 Tax=Nocardiopsis baichengensis TaxID=280240 RepID=UPI0003465B25|nr:HAD-IB family phosphatase [Nocardiopsis baichengensis]